MKFIRLSLLGLLISSVAGVSYADSYRAVVSDCSRCYECSCNPLYECSWGLQFAVGVRPIVWKHRGDFLIVNCNEVAPVVALGELPRFNSLYKTPWQVGVQLSYATSCNTNLFGEFNYAQSSFRCCDSVFIGDSDLQVNLTKYKLYEAYFGGRYYFDRWCDRVAFFLGGKIGVMHHKQVQTSSFTGVTEDSIISECCTDLAPLHVFCDKHNSFAGGGHLGFDICLTGNFSFVITAEVLATCGCGCGNRFELNVIDSAFLNGSALLTPGVSTELAFPVTFGFKYNF